MCNIHEIHIWNHDLGEMQKNARKMQCVVHAPESSRMIAGSIVDGPLNVRPARAWVARFLPCTPLTLRSPFIYWQIPSLDSPSFSPIHIPSNMHRSIQLRSFTGRARLVIAVFVGWPFGQAKYQRWTILDRPDTVSVNITLVPPRYRSNILRLIAANSGIPRLPQNSNYLQSITFFRRKVNRCTA